MTKDDMDAAGLEVLRDAVRARDSFLDIAAHELRNPMGALLLQVERLLKKSKTIGDAALTRDLVRLEQAIQRYVLRATTLLDISRINSGRLTVDCVPTDFAEIVRNVTESYSAEAEYFESPIRLNSVQQLSVVSDPIALEQITGNLVSNALKYGGGAPVDVFVQDTGDFAKLTVQDQGIGISEEDQQRIFERFERLFVGTPRAGFGIGLWLVKQLVQALGGAIEIDSKPGRGSSFLVTIPKKVRQEAEAP